MITATDKLRGLVETVYQKTASGDIMWNLTSDKSRVWVIIDEFQLELNEEPSNQSFEKDIRYTVYNAEGDQVDTFTDQTLSGHTPVSISMNSYYGVMSATVELANRQASGADKAIYAILTALGGSPVNSKLSVQPSFASDLDDDVPF